MQKLRVKIGLDLDNTILDYSSCFQLAAKEVLGLSLPPGASKQDQKFFIERSLGDDEWTLLQGYAYGEFSFKAELFPHFLDFMKLAEDIKADVLVVSHKSRYPIIGPSQDLRGFALSNLDRLGVLERLAGFPRSENSVYFCDSRDEKIERIRSMGFKLFVDDLFGVVSSIPAEVQRFHIYCAGNHETVEEVTCVTDWNSMQRMLQVLISADL